MTQFELPLLLLACSNVLTLLGVVPLLLRVIRKQELILRKLNNSQPDDEGGY